MKSLLELAKRFRKDKIRALPSEIQAAKDRDRLIVLTDESLEPHKYVQTLVDQLKDDVFPLFTKTVGAAPFTIARNSFCYIDHVSRLLYGKKFSDTTRMIKVIESFAQCEPLLRSRYKQYAPYLVQHYRHDLVHNIRPLPKIITVRKNGKKTKELSWFFVFSKTETGLTFDTLKTNFSDIKFRRGFCHLRYTGNQIVINTNSLFFDTVIFLSDLCEQLKTDQALQKKVASNYYKIIERNLYTVEDRFILNKDSDKEVTDIFRNT